MSEARPPSSVGGVEPRLQALLAELQRAGLEPGAEELADALWLAAHITPRPRVQDRPARREHDAQAGRESSAAEADTSARPPDAPSAERPQPRHLSQPQTELYPRTGAPGGRRSARPFRAPAVPMLPDALDLGRALRPLHQNVPSRTRHELDEAATVDGIAQSRMARQRFWQPVQQRTMERWFDLALIVDQGASMAIWQPLLAALRRLLLYNGAFRDVHTWYLETDADEARLCAGSHAETRRTCVPQELLAPRRLFWVVSDCTSRAWYTGSVNELLQPWSERAPLTLLHLLPPRLWRRTALGRGVETRLSAPEPGAPNDRLWHDAADFELLDMNGGTPGKVVKPVLKLPVLSLEPEVLLSWANMVNGKPQTWVRGVVFTENAQFAAAVPDSAPALPDPGVVDQRLQRFFARASPLAQQLAGYFAAAPLTVQVMRLVQQVMLPHSGQTHLAEVFVSGLLKRHEMAPDDPLYYDFFEGVRERLLDLTGASESTEVLRQVSRFVADRTGDSLDFQALLDDPNRQGDLTLDEHAQYFARIAAKVLRRLGGAYETLANRLEASGGPSTAPREPTEPTPFRDRFLDEEAEGPEMVWLPGGRFVMGDDESEFDFEKPVHEVELRPFSIGKYPVTFEEYDAFCDATDREKPGDEEWGRDRRPVINVSWEDAAAYCEWLREKTGQDYRLLTEAQWEYACRAGSRTAFCFGDDEEELGEYAWYYENSDEQTHAVGEKEPNAWGLHDMHGNVWEWVQDWHSDYSGGLQHDPSGPAEGSFRVIRGGSWFDGAANCRSAYRDFYVPAVRDDGLGFRLARLGPLPSYPFTLSPDSAAPVPDLKDKLTDGTDGPAMVWLPGGVYMMGDDRSPHDDERPAHEVAVDAFSIGQYPVTFEAYDRFCEATDREKPDDEGWGRGQRPAINVSWEDAAAYCAWLSGQTGEHYRLITEAEWEYACRAGRTTYYCFGDDEERLGDYAWYGANADGMTHPVGEKRSNEWHLYDMHGNVLEWVQDWHADGYYSNSPRENPSGPAEGSFRVIRGGGWVYDAAYCRSASRYFNDPANRIGYLGFRLARTGPWRFDTFTLGASQAPDVPTERIPYEGFRDRLADGTDAPEMVYVPGGTFNMGDIRGDGFEDERPVHEVSLDDFAIGRYPVTLGEYMRFVEKTNSHYPEWLEEGSEYHLTTGRDDHYRRVGVNPGESAQPIVGISWEDAAAYCEWLSEQTRERYSLLTEAEWEYACRAGSEANYSFGNDADQLGEYAWYRDNSDGRIHPVGQKTPNEWNLYDMHGNVWEWVQDWHGDYSEELQHNPSGPAAGSSRVIRGGSWILAAAHCRSAARNFYVPAFRFDNLGFRLARRV